MFTNDKSCVMVMPRSRHDCTTGKTFVPRNFHSPTVKDLGTFTPGELLTVRRLSAEDTLTFENDVYYSTIVVFFQRVSILSNVFCTSML